MSVDISQAVQVGAFEEAIRETFTMVDVLINNAGVFMPSGAIKTNQKKTKKKT